VPPFDTGDVNSPIQVVIKGDSLDKLNEISLKLKEKMENTKGIVDVDRDYEEGKPEVKITIQRENAIRAGISVAQIATLLNSGYSSDSAISKYEEGGKEYDITIRFLDEYREKIDDLKKIQIKNSNGEFVSLDGIVIFEESQTVASINRFDRERKVLVSANMFEIALDSAVSEIEKAISEILPDGYSYRFTGDVENMQETGQAFGAAVLLAVILIYLILAGLYESLIQPLIIMISMPLSFTGVVLALYLSGNSFSLFVMIGVILLLGMVGKNAILVIDFANRAIKDGKNIDEALIEAGEKRFRPVLMTSCAMIGAMIPLAFGGGAGFESNSPMALAIIGGLVSSTILTLLVVPAFYKLLYPIDKFLRKFYEKGVIK
ncbi:MAG: efflux RND transporter permease subunit, partial [Campylobacterales bacterium]|nr:efflux RND transporter permease subunit [Campylobacterales bacterium]